LKSFDILSAYLNSFLHLFYPQICFGCGTDELDKSKALCASCIKALPYTDFFQIRSNPIEKIFWGRVPVQYAGAVLFFTKDSLVQTLMAQLKYHHNKKVGILFGQLIGEAINAEASFKTIDLLVPIPIRTSKLNKRGYNQSTIIAMGIQENCTIPIGDFLKKKKWTSTQTKKDRNSRLQSIPDLFTLTNAETLKGKHVLIIDDVLTTGATIEAAVTCLITAEPASISIAVAAYTL
jgi:ComF family protein